MTENLLHKLEEKMMVMLTEVEELRKDVQQLTQENTELRREKEKYMTEKMSHEKKLQDLLSLFDAVKSVESTLISSNQHIAPSKPVLVQG